MHGSIAASKQPNIVLILMDNLGYGELGVYGAASYAARPLPALTNWLRKARASCNLSMEAIRKCGFGK
jgi:hypothetical protein